MNKKGKRIARILALQAMYACDVRPDDDPTLIFETIKENSSYSMKMANYAELLVVKALDESKEIDKLLEKFAENWDIKRMAVVDRNILRIAIVELRHFKEIPFKVIIDEAVEIAKLYGTNESSKFVNGILDTIYINEFNKS